MKLFGRDIQGHAKFLVILTSILVVASGLCGVQIAILDSKRGGVDSLSVIFAVTGILEAGVILISVLGIVLVLIGWAYSRVFPRTNTTLHLSQDTKDKDPGDQP